MLKRASTDNLSEINELCNSSIVGTKILCYIKAYGFNRDFLEIWVINQEGSITGVITKFYDDVTLVCNKSVDIEQLKAFLNMFGYNSIMLNETLCKNLGFKNFIVKNAYCYKGSFSDDFVTDRLTEDDHKKAYELISNSIPGSFAKDKEAYLSFISDYTFRERRNLARGVCTHHSNGLASVAITSSETDSAAIISGVACAPDLRSKGRGKRTVISIAESLKKENKTVYVIALNESAAGFYKHIGFEFEEKIAFVERKKDV